VDNDGWIDLYVVGGSKTAPGIGENQLLHNENQTENHWFQVELCGTISNRTAIGTRVTIRYEDVNDEEAIQIREMQSGMGYNSQDMLRSHFGLGGVTEIDLLTIRWPSGIVQTKENVGVDQMIRIVEDEMVFAFDCNRNCIDDVVDIIEGLSIDGNGNEVPDECECISDLDNDGEVNVHDILILIANWELDEPQTGDLDGDQDVDIHDMLILIGDWGPC
jgi:hypothetical protein